MVNLLENMTFKLSLSLSEHQNCLPDEKTIGVHAPIFLFAQ